MTNLNAVLQQLESERSALQVQIKQLDSALQVLEGLYGTGGSRGGPRRLSAAARNRIAAAQRARWAKWKATQKKK